MGASESGQRKSNSAESYFSESERKKLIDVLQKLVDDKSRITSTRFTAYLKERNASEAFQKALFEYIASLTKSSHSKHHNDQITGGDLTVFLAHLFKGSNDQIAPLVTFLASGKPDNASTAQIKKDPEFNAPPGIGGTKKYRPPVGDFFVTLSRGFTADQPQYQPQYRPQDQPQLHASPQEPHSGSTTVSTAGSASENQLLQQLLELSGRSLKRTDSYNSWSLVPEASTNKFTDYLMNELDMKDGSVLSSGEFEDSLRKCHIIPDLIRLAFTHLFPIIDPSTSYPLLPSCNIVHGNTKSTTKPPSILDTWSLLVLNQSVPHELRVEWRPLFNSRIQGESFGTMIKYITNSGPTMLVIRDEDGNVFGGFAAESWAMKPKFYGTSHCFLFSLSPSLQIFSPSGYNENFMYLNQHQQTLPNGLAMGGQFDYFGLWLAPEYGSGHSKAEPKCTTYGSPQLSSTADFKVEHIEVWGVGAIKREEGEEEGEGAAAKPKGVLNASEELQNLVEMSGRKLVSREIRAADQKQERDQEAFRVIGQPTTETTPST